MKNHSDTIWNVRGGSSEARAEAIIRHSSLCVLCLCTLDWIRWPVVMCVRQIFSLFSFSFSLSNGNHFAVKHLFSIWIPFTTAWCHGLKFGPLFTSSTYRSIGRTVCTVWTHWISKWKTRNHFQHSIELPRWLLVESDFRLNAHSDRSLANDWHFFFFHSYAVCAPLFSHLIRMQSIFTYQSIINNIKRLWCSDPKSDGINFKITAIH